MFEFDAPLDGFTPWPTADAERYRQAGYWTGETLGAMLSRLARAHTTSIAIADSQSTINYEQLEHRTNALAIGLIGLGIRPKDRVVVQLPNGVIWYEVCFALWKAGAIAVLAQPAHRAHEIGSFINQTGAKAYIIPDQFERFDYRELAETIRQRTAVEHVIVSGQEGKYISLSSLYTADAHAPSPKVDAGSVALLQLSGGSTGVPKLIPRTHDDYMYSVRQSVHVCGWTSDLVYAVALPCAHNFPLSSPGALGALIAGGTVLALPNADPATAFPLLQRHRATAVSLVPSLVNVWCASAKSMRDVAPSLATLQVGGAKLDRTGAEKAFAWSQGGLQQVFGMAEGLVNYTRVNDERELILSTQGRPMSPADEVNIVDAEDKPVAEGEIGHLLTRGPYTIRGYYRAAQHNLQSFTADGFYRTGDLVRRLQAGHLVVEGRAKDQINRGGEKISAQELELLLRQTGLVTDAALVPVPDPLLGEKSCAFVCGPDASLTPAQVRQALKQLGVAAYKLPDHVVWLPQLPRTPIGKVNKPELIRHHSRK